MDLHDKFQSWATSQKDELEGVDVLGNNIAIQFFCYEHNDNTGLTDLEGNLLAEKYGKEIFNVCKVLTLGEDYKGPLKVGDLVSLLDESLDPIADPSQGFKPDGSPNAGYVPLGRLVPFTYIVNKLSQPKQDLIFIISPAWISVRHKNLNNLLTQAKAKSN